MADQYFSPRKIGNCVEEARELAETCLMSQLSLCERMFLRRIINQSINDLPENIWSPDDYDVVGESAVRFLHEFYENKSVERLFELVMGNPSYWKDVVRKGKRMHIKYDY